jgi:hypothetical protein
MVDRFFSSIGQNFHDPPVGFQPHPHHGRNSIAGDVGQCTT